MIANDKLCQIDLDAVHYNCGKCFLYGNQLNLDRKGNCKLQDKKHELEGHSTCFSRPSVLVDKIERASLILKHKTFNFPSRFSLIIIGAF